MKRFVVCSLACFVFFKTNAQPNYYLFKQNTAPYTDLTQDVAVTPANFGSGDLYWLDELTGETFDFFDRTIVMDASDSRISFSTNGHVQVEHDNTDFMLFDGLFRTLDSIDATSKLSAKIEGSGSSKIVKLQWKNLKIASGPAGNFVNLQIWLYQETGIVEYRYGPSSASNASGYTNSTGPSIGISHNNPTFTTMYEKIWVTNHPSDIILDSAKTIAFPNIHGVPPANTVYRFIPKSIAASVPIILGKDQEMIVFPNPANGHISFTLSKAADSNIKVLLTNMSGKVMTTTLISAGEETATISLSDLPPGTYLLSADGSKQVHRLIIQ